MGLSGLMGQICRVFGRRLLLFDHLSPHREGGSEWQKLILERNVTFCGSTLGGYERFREGIGAFRGWSAEIAHRAKPVWRNRLEVLGRMGIASRAKFTFPPTPPRLGSERTTDFADGHEPGAMRPPATKSQERKTQLFRTTDYRQSAPVLKCPGRTVHNPIQTHLFTTPTAKVFHFFPASRG